MNRKNIQRRLYRILRKLGVNREDICLNADIRDDLGLDDFDRKLYLYYVESNFKIDLLDNQLPKLNKIRDTVNILEKTLLKNSA